MEDYEYVDIFALTLRHSVVRQLKHTALQIWHIISSVYNVVVSIKRIVHQSAWLEVKQTLRNEELFFFNNGLFNFFHDH